MQTNYNGWKDLQTLQSKEIINELIECKEEPMAKILISETGLGKTNSIRLFQNKMPKDTYVVTVGYTYNLRNIIVALMGQLGIERPLGKNGNHIGLRVISDTLNEIKEKGGNPIVVIDESENVGVPGLKALKELYDYVMPNCSIVLIGTPQLLDLLERKWKGQSIPQLKRRFKAGTRIITPLKKSRDFKPFFDLYIPTQKDVQDILLKLADNYGELRDYLEPVLKHSARYKVPVTEQLFRLKHKISPNS